MKPNVCLFTHLTILIVFIDHMKVSHMYIKPMFELIFVLYIVDVSVLQAKGK